MPSRRSVLGSRLWRVRRRQDHIDAVLRTTGQRWTLEFSRNNRVLVTWRFASEDAARWEATTRRRELERAGWVAHW